MRFPKSFVRTKGSGTLLLGADTFPTNPGGSFRKPAQSDDNVFFTKSVSTNGWPLSRIIVHAVYTGSATVPAALPIAVYCYEDHENFWFLLSQSATTLVPSTPSSATPTATLPVYFNTVSLIDLPNRLSDDYASASGSAAFLVIVGDPGAGAPNGSYTFIVGGELATKSF